MSSVVDELSQPVPSKSKLEELGNALISACNNAAIYCGSIVDEGVKAGVKIIGAGAGAYLLNHLLDGRVMDFAERLIQFAMK